MKKLTPIPLRKTTNALAGKNTFKNNHGDGAGSGELKNPSWRSVPA